MNILRVTEAGVCGPHHLALAFTDGARGVADVASLLDGPIFEPLREAAYFARGRFDPVGGTVAWPNGADLAPEALRAVVIESSPRALA